MKSSALLLAMALSAGAETSTYRHFDPAPDNAEHAGYLASTQSPDHVIHLISSRLHYRFNLAWVKNPAP